MKYLFILGVQGLTLVAIWAVYAGDSYMSDEGTGLHSISKNGKAN